MELDDVERIAAKERYLAVVSTARADGTIQSSVVNAGILAHPVSGARAVGFVTYGRAKLANLRRRPHATIVFRAGWEWAAVEGGTEVIGPDDQSEGFDPSALPTLLRSVFTSAGGSHDDWETFDRVMKEERRSAVLLQPERIYSNAR
jgi:PPOX class probable F420-dependent enzyme